MDIVKDQQELDSVLMFEQACAFCSCAEFTEMEGCKIPNRTRAHTFAGMSLSAFACELFIKCAIVARGGMYGMKHTLNELWDVYHSLDSDAALRIENSILTSFRYDDVGEFDRMLSEVSNAFVQWRYIFDYTPKERVGGSRQFLRLFRIALRNMSSEVVLGCSWKAGSV